MSAVELLAERIGIIHALAYFALLAFDTIRAAWERQRFNRLDDRVGRLEAAFIQTDGGSTDD